MTIDPEGVTEAIAGKIGTFVQGQIFDLRSLPVMSTRHNPLNADAISHASQNPTGADVVIIAARVTSGRVMLVTQTCDLQRDRTLEGRTLAHVAPLVTLELAVENDVLHFSRPRFVAAPWAGAGLYADLDQLAPVDRGLLAIAPMGPAPAEGQRRELAYHLGRPYSRPALPDDVVKIIDPIRKAAVEAKDVNVRRVLDEAVRQVRVMPNFEYGSAGQIHVTLFFLVDPMWLPDAEPVKFRMTGKDLKSVAEPLIEAFESGDDAQAGVLVTLWRRFLDILEEKASKAISKAKNTQVSGITLSPVAALQPADYEGSDKLDLSHLSLTADDDLDEV